MKNKNAFITGVNGGIGGGIARVLLSNGYKVYGPVRDLEKEKEKLSAYPSSENLFVVQADLGNSKVMDEYISDLFEKKIYFSVMILAAGGLRYDSSFDDGKRTKEEIIEESIRENCKINLDTKINIILPYLNYYKKEAKNTKLYPIGSQAAGFPKDHPWRVNEEGYSECQLMVRINCQRFEEFFYSVDTEEPELIDTKLSRENFPLDDSGKPRDWSKVISPENFSLVFAKKHGLI